MEQKTDPCEEVTYGDIVAAHERIKALVRRTPILQSETMNEMAGGKELFFKCELFQKTGSFKFRGACNAVFKLSDEVASAGVVTHSSGNHAQALSCAARARGINAYVVVPRNAPEIKRTAIMGYGGIVTLCDPSTTSREETASQIVAETGGTFISSHNDRDIIAGQGTIACELLEDIDVPLDALVVPAGGGGMLAGICIAAAAKQPGIRVFAAEPARANSISLSLETGERVTIDNAQTIADGVRVSVGTNTLPIIVEHVERSFTVSEEEIAAAMRIVWERMKITIETSAAVGVAVVLSEAFKELEGIQRVGVVLCGGNVDLDSVPWARP